MADPIYEYAVFEGDRMAGRPWQDEHSASEFRLYLMEQQGYASSDRSLVIRRRVVSGWENVE